MGRLMRKSWPRLTTSVCALLWFGLCLPASAQEGPGLTGELLISALRQGGYNLYFRHAETDWSQSDRISQKDDWSSCDPGQVRQLSDSGRRSAKMAGEAMRALGIPVALVLASPYCRTMETAKYLGLGPVVATTDIINMRVSEYFDGREAVAERARQRLASVPPAGGNTVLVAHGNVAIAATTIYPGEAEALVFRPDGQGFEFVGRLTPEQWQDLAEAGGAEQLAVPAQ
jgi:broad specificity phosphatase PhoE